ncbi:MAG: hypothetical protein ACYC0X_01095 [Pirellulaceae bacterium]
MKKVNMFMVAALLAGIGQVAGAQEAKHSDHDQPQMTHDQLRIAVQEICPISGQKLGAMGAPVKAKIGQEEVFLCCQGCLKEKVSTDHWATIHANVAKAQAKCPVMDKSLPKNPKWVIVAGQIFYICCPPCAKKIEADPKTYVAKVDKLYASSLDVRSVPDK